MSADDQIFLDVLSAIRRTSSQVADSINNNVDTAANFIRDSLADREWLPQYLRPTPPSPPPAPVLVVPGTQLERVKDWIVRHKILTGVIVVAVGTVAFRTYRRARLGKKTRRARKSSNGQRLDVVVIAGSPALALTRSLALDLERRGFVVYVVCSSTDEESAVMGMSRSDIRSLALDTTDPPSAGASIERFALYLNSRHSATPRMKPYHLTLKSVILIPSLNYQTSPIATIPPSNFADLFNTHLLHPILTIQAFLPLLTARMNPVGEKWHPAKVMVLTPSIISSINPPFHAPEATVCSALSAFTEVLTAELRPLGIPVTHMQLGTFDLNTFTPGAGHGRLRAPGPNADATETLLWPDGARHAYGRNFTVQSTSVFSAGRIRGIKGSSVRLLHNSVFDVIDGSITSDTVRIGLGASMYGFVGRWFPRGLVSWMMGIRKVDELSTWQGSSCDGSQAASDDDESPPEFVAVAADGGVESSVWKRD